MKAPEKPASYVELVISEQKAKMVNVYFVPGKNKHGETMYIYAVASAIVARANDESN